jgi:hypothetical protein
VDGHAGMRQRNGRNGEAAEEAAARAAFGMECVHQIMEGGPRTREPPVDHVVDEQNSSLPPARLS